MPQTSPEGEVARAVWGRQRQRQGVGMVVDGGELDGEGEKEREREKERAEFLSPLYDRLETNIPRSLMGFSDLEWPASAQLFPKHEEVERYLEEYAEEVRHLIRFQTQVVDLRIAGRRGRQAQWRLKTRDIERGNEGREWEDMYDAVVVASGHFDVPYIPDIEGIEEWSQLYPGIISHSKFYSKPEQFEGQVSG